MVFTPLPRLVLSVSCAPPFTPAKLASMDSSSGATRHRDTVVAASRQPF